MPEAELRVAPHVRRGEWREALWKLQRVEALQGGRPNAVVRNTVLSVLKVAKRWQEALEIFALAQNRLTFNVAATALAAADVWRRSLILLQQMMLLTLLPDLVNMNSSMNLFKGLSHWPKAVNLLGQMSLVQLEADLVSTNTCIAACQQGGRRWPLALQLADGRSLDAAAAVALLAYEARWLWAQALQVFGRFVEASIQLSMQVVTQAMRICEKHELWNHAASLLCEALCHGQQMDVVALGAALGARQGHWRRCQGLLTSAIQKSMRSNVIVLSSAISGCEKGFEWQGALHLSSLMQVLLLRPNAFSVSATLTALEKCHYWSRALHLLEGDGWLRPTNRVSLNAAMSACEKASKWLQTLQLLEAPNSSPDVLALSATLSALAQGAQWREALDMLRSFESWQVLPNEVSYSAAITAMEKVGLWQFSLALLEEMMLRSLEPDVFAHNAAMAACLRAVESAAMGKKAKGQQNATSCEQSKGRVN
eukprot:s1909_g6.t1